jgi:PHD/YefM family antitoxin component YafN of YafNO toxin-antitoxin module
MSRIRTEDINSVTDFRGKVRKHLARLKTTGRAEILTVNGRAAGVVMSPATYQRLVDYAEYGRSIRLIRQSIREFEDGKGISADIVFAELKDKLTGRGQ